MKVESSMANEPERRPVPDILLEQYRLDELQPADAARVRAALAADPAVGERLAALEMSDQAIGQLYPPETFADRVRPVSEASPRRRGTGRRWVLPLVLTAAAVTVALAVPAMISDRAAPGVDNESPTGEGNRIKALRPALVVYRRTDRGSETLADGAVARPGDVVRLGYVPADRTYGVIVSVDTRGTITQHLPQSGSRAVTLAHERMNLLATAYALDEVQGWERFYFV